MPKQRKKIAKPVGFARHPGALQTQYDAAMILFDVPEVASVYAPQTGVVNIMSTSGETKEMWLGVHRDQITQGLHEVRALLMAHPF